MSKKFVSYRSYESSTYPLSACEERYAVHPNIIQFYCTFAALYSILYFPILISLSSDISDHVVENLELIWLFWLIEALSSAYYHATLSIAGEILVDVSLIWLLTIAHGYWFHLVIIHGNHRILITREKLWPFLEVSAVGFTVVSYFYQSLLVYGIMAAAYPAFLVFLGENVTGDPYFTGVKKTTLLQWLLVVAMLIADNVHCTKWKALGFPYLYPLAQMLAFHAMSSTLVLYAYLYYRHEHEHRVPKLHFWPSDNVWFGVLYLSYARIPRTVGNLMTLQYTPSVSATDAESTDHDVSDLESDVTTD